MQEISIDSVVDLNNSFKQIDDLIAYIDKVDRKIVEVNKNQLKVGGIQSLRELNQVMSELQKTTQELNAIVSQSNKTQQSSNQVKAEAARVSKEAAQAQAAEAKAANENEIVKRTAAQTAKEQALAKKAEAQALKELAAAEKQEAQALKEGNVAKKLEAQTSKEIAIAKLTEAKALKELYQAELAEAKTATEVAKQKKLITQERERAEKAAKAEQKLIDDIGNDYKQLSLAYNEAALKAKNYAIRLGESHPLTVQAVKDAKDLSDFLKRIDAAVGQNQRNVGNYAESLSGAFEKVREEIARLKTEQKGLQDLTNNSNRNTVGFQFNSDRLNQVTAAIQQLETIEQKASQTTGSYAQQVQVLENSLGELASSGTHDIGFLRSFQQEIQKAKTASGQTARGFDSLQFSMQQLLRETPSLAIGINTFFLAISNNLPQFFDAMDQVKAKNEALAASGEKPIPVYQQLIKNLFSFQTALTVGITLITVYGTKLIDWFNSIGKGGGDVDNLKKKLAGFNAEVRQSSEDLDLFFKYLDRLNKAPKVQLEIDNTNIPVLNGMRNELKALGLEAEDAQHRLTLSLEQFGKANEARGKIEQKFFSKASKEAIEAVENGTVDQIKDKLSERDIVLIDALKEAKANFTKADEEIADLKTTLDVTNKNIALKAAEIAKEESEQTRKIILDNATYVYNVTKSLNDDVLASDRSTLRQRLNALRSNFEAEKSIIQARKKNVLDDPTASRADRNEAIKTALADEKAARIQFNQDTFREKEAFRLRDLEADKSMYVRGKELQAEAFKELSENLKFSLKDRLQLQQNYLEAQKDILEAEYRQKLANAGLSDQEIQAFEQDKTYKVQSKKITDEELLNLASEYESQVIKLSIEGNKAITENLKREIDKQQQLRQQDVEHIKSVYSNLDLKTNIDYSQDVIALNESLKKKEISITQYNERRKRIERQYAGEILNIQIDAIEAELNTLGGVEARFEAAELHKQNLEQQFADAKTDIGRKQLLEEIDLAEKDLQVAKINFEAKKKMLEDLAKLKKQVSDQGKSNDDEDKEKFKKDFNDLLDAANNLGEAVSTVGDGAFDKRMQQIQDEMTALDQRYAHEKELIEKTSANELEKKQRLAEAEAKYAGQRKALEEQEKQERIRKAEFDKKAAIFNIIISTARAVVEALPNIPKAVTAGVLGAAQLAVAVSAPIPRFFKGKNLSKTQAQDNYEGPAWVDDGGRPELIIREDGRMEVGTNQPRITYLRKNDIVLPDAKVAPTTLINRAMLNSHKAVVDYRLFERPNNGEVEALREQTGILKREIRFLREDVRATGKGNKKLNWHDHWMLQDTLRKLNGG
jgi:hypothetical protein